MKEELLGIERYHGPKERSLAQASSNLEAMQTTKDGLEAELHQVGILYLDNCKINSSVCDAVGEKRRM